MRYCALLCLELVCKSTHNNSTYGWLQAALGPLFTSLNTVQNILYYSPAPAVITDLRPGPS